MDVFHATHEPGPHSSGERPKITRPVQSRADGMDTISVRSLARTSSGCFRLPEGKSPARGRHRRNTSPDPNNKTRPSQRPSSRLRRMSSTGALMALRRRAPSPAQDSPPPALARKQRSAPFKIRRGANRCEPDERRKNDVLLPLHNVKYQDPSKIQISGIGYRRTCLV